MSFFVPTAAALFIVAGVTGVGVWLLVDTGSSSERTLTDEPIVEGRLFWGSVGTLRDGSGYHSRCEADAHVRIERDTIIEVLEHGDRPKIEVGEKLDRDLYVEPGEEFIEERGHPPTVFDLYVYRDDDGVIRTGCSPESILIIDGVVKTYEEWVDEGRVPPPRGWSDES